MPVGRGRGRRRRRAASPASATARGSASSSRARRVLPGRGGASSRAGNGGELGGGSTRRDGGDSHNGSNDRSDGYGSNIDGAGTGSSVSQHRSSAAKNGVLPCDFLHRAAMQPRASLAWLWGAIGVALCAFVLSRLYTSEDAVDVHQWSAEEAQGWFETRRDGEWQAHATAFAGLKGIDLAALTRDGFKQRLASTGDTIFNDWRADVAAAGDEVDVHQWSAEEVQGWFKTRRDGEWQAHATAFAGLKGIDLAALTRDGFKERLASTGDTIFNDWRAYVAEHSMWGVATATLQQWELVALLLVAAAGSALFYAWFRNYASVIQLRAFATALRRVACSPLPPAGGVVDFGLPTLNDKHVFEGPSKVFMRECYVPLLELYLDDEVEATRCRVVIGNPGIGKSMLRLLVACKALAAGFDVAFAKFDGSDLAVFVVSADGHNDRVLDSPRQLRLDTRFDKLIVVADVGKGDLRLIEGFPSARRWYFTSPNSKIARDALTSGNVFLWQPLWALAELKRAATQLGLHLVHEADHLLPDPAVRALFGGGSVHDRDEIVKMRSYQFGGIARVVLATDNITILSHLKAVRSALANVIETGGDAAVNSLFNAKRSRFESAHTLVGVRTTFGHGGDRTKWYNDVSLDPENVPVVTFYPDTPGAAFLQLPVDWLSRPLREMGFQSLVRRYDVANKALPFGSWPAGAEGIFSERFTFNRMVLAAAAGKPVFERLHRMKAAARRGQSWKPRDLSTDTQLGAARVHAVRRYVRLPHRRSDGYDEMTSVLDQAIEEAKAMASNRALLLLPTSDTCPVFDGILLLGGAPVGVLFLQVTLQRAHAVDDDKVRALQFFEAALGVVRDLGDGVRVAIVYVLGSSNYDSFSAQRQDGPLARRIAQYKAKASPFR